MPTELAPPPPHLVERLRERAPRHGIGEEMVKSLLQSLALVEREMVRAESYGTCGRKAALRAITVAFAPRTAERHIEMLGKAQVLVRDGDSIRLAW